eukprot:7384104-Prymnesium_polylepis.2
MACAAVGSAARLLPSPPAAAAASAAAFGPMRRANASAMVAGLHVIQKQELPYACNYTAHPSRVPSWPQSGRSEFLAKVFCPAFTAAQRPQRFLAFISTPRYGLGDEARVERGGGAPERGRHPPRF